MSSAAAKTIKGVLTYEEFLTIFESHNRAYLDEVRELVGGTAQTLLESGKLTPESLFAASQKHPWALGNLGGKTGSSTQVDTQRVGKLELELAAARAEVAATKQALRDALNELDGEYALAEARATAAVEKAQADQLAAAVMVGRAASSNTTTANDVPATPLPLDNSAPEPRTIAARASPPPQPAPASSVRHSNSSNAASEHEVQAASESGMGSESDSVGRSDDASTNIAAQRASVVQRNARAFLDSDDDEDERPSVGGFT